MSSTPFIKLKNVQKSFVTAGQVCCKALEGINLEIRRGEMVALLGASGSGKSTLMRVMNGLHRADKDSEGLVEINGRVLQKEGRLSPETRAIRGQIATIFQQFNLVSRLKVITNVCVGTVYATPWWRAITGQFSQETKLRALEALDQVGIQEHAFKRARLLSGGQQQRVAIARAIAQGAELVLADEPIASLDPESSRLVMELLVGLNQKGCTVIVSLHQVAVALKYCQRVVALKEGRVVYDGPSESLTEAQLRELYGADSDLVFDDLAIKGSPGSEVASKPASAATDMPLLGPQPFLVSSTSTTHNRSLYERFAS
ncbi:MAG: phosphonate ABC transporter ATP-binding protein [Burkholderiaceae bacterium]